MRTQRAHPLFSRFGCGTALLLAIGLAAILYFRGGGPFSPGHLSAAQPTGQELGGFSAHSEFEPDCAQCHAPWQGVTAERCENCHTNVAGQRQSGTGLHGRLTDTGRCQTCHTDHKGRNAQTTQISLTGFDHDRLVGFSLARHQTDYNGQPLACEGCHTANRFAAEFLDCVTCHQNADATFMQEHTTRFGRDCLACHDGVDRLANFDHATVFVLEGAHVTAACEGCHANQVFQGTPRECANCHEEPAIHAGIFGLDCARCHTALAWSPAQLTQHTFLLDHGGEGQLACETCHEASYTVYTCYNCHEHDPAGIRRKHEEEDIFAFENCVECHPTGQESDFEGNDHNDD